MQMIKPLEEPVLILRPDVYLKGRNEGLFSIINNTEYYNGFKLAVSTNMEKDQLITTLSDMPICGTYPN